MQKTSAAVLIAVCLVCNQAQAPVEPRGLVTVSAVQGGIAPIYEEHIVQHLSRKTKNALKRLQYVRSGRFHTRRLDADFVDDEHSILPELAKLLSNARRACEFDDAEENHRLEALDYLGEKLVGRLQTSQRSQIIRMLQEHVDFDPLESGAPDRQKQSVLGDQIEIMQYFARFDEKEASNLLSRYDRSKRYDFLKTGFENGLWMSGTPTQAPRS